jgi:hypothetical protein
VPLVITVMATTTSTGWCNEHARFDRAACGGAQDLGRWSVLWAQLTVAIDAVFKKVDGLRSGFSAVFGRLTQR